jgi:zinc protease
MRTTLLLTLLVTTSSLAQDLTHPLEMGLPQGDYERPDPAEHELALENGLIAYVAVADQVPLVTLSAFVRAGLVNDETQGAAEALLAALKDAGPAGVGAGNFKRRLRAMTADFNVAMHDEWTEISLNVPTEDVDEALEIFAGLLRSPEIAGESIERAARHAEPAARDLGGESGAALYEGSMNAAVGHFYEIIYANHPFGRRPTRDEFDKLRVEDVADFHARYFVPGNLTIAVAGDIDLEAVNAELVETFGDWPAAEVPAVKPQPAATRSRATLHHFPSDKLQSWLIIGHDLPPIPIEEQAAFDVMNYIVGEYHMNTRLIRETRYKYGYTNDASSFAEDRWYGPGGYTFRSYSRPEVIENIYRNIMGELIRTREEDVSERELFVAKGALSDGAFQVRYLDGYALTRSFALERLRYGNHERSATYVSRVRAVTKQDVLKAAQKYIRPDDMQVVLLGEEAFDID